MACGRCFSVMCCFGRRRCRRIHAERLRHGRGLEFFIRHVFVWGYSFVALRFRGEHGKAFASGDCGLDWLHWSCWSLAIIVAVVSIGDPVIRLLCFLGNITRSPVGIGSARRRVKVLFRGNHGIGAGVSLYSLLSKERLSLSQCFILGFLVPTVEIIAMVEVTTRLSGRVWLRVQRSGLTSRVGRVRRVGHVGVCACV